MCEIVFKIRYHRLSNDEHVFVYGDVAELGLWDDKRAVQLHHAQIGFVFKKFRFRFVSFRFILLFIVFSISRWTGRIKIDTDVAISFTFLVKSG